MARKFVTLDLRNVIHLNITDTHLKEKILNHLSDLNPANVNGPGNCKRWCTDGSSTYCCDPPTLMLNEKINSNRLLLEKVIKVKASDKNNNPIAVKETPMSNIQDFKVIAVSPKTKKVDISIPLSNGESFSFKLDAPFSA